MITALYYGALRIHEANKNVIWNRLDTLALIAIFIFPIPYIFYFFKFTYSIFKQKTCYNIWSYIKFKFSLKVNPLKRIVKQMKYNIFRDNTSTQIIFIIIMLILLFLWFLQLYITLTLASLNIIKSLPH